MFRDRIRTNLLLRKREIKRLAAVNPPVQVPPDPPPAEVINRAEAALADFTAQAQQGAWPISLLRHDRQEGARMIWRVWRLRRNLLLLMMLITTILPHMRAGTTITLSELWYQHREHLPPVADDDPPARFGWKNRAERNEIIHLARQVIGVRRYSLKIVPTVRGDVAGCVTFHSADGLQSFNCSTDENAFGKM